MLEQLSSLLRSLFTLFVIGAVIWLATDVTGLIPRAKPTPSAARAHLLTAPTATHPPTKTPQQLLREATYLDPRRLAADPTGYVGQNVYLQGNAQGVEQQEDYTWVNRLAGVKDRTVEESVVVEVRPRNLDVLREECYQFFGIVAGTTGIRNVLTGAEAERSLVEAYAFEPSARIEYSGCEAP